MVDARHIFRFFEKTAPVPPSNCLAWTGAMDSGGYGQMRVRGRITGAHRIAYLIFRGHIPAGMTIDHLCRNRWCVYSAHLEAVPMKENVLRGQGATAINSRKTQCPAGHGDYVKRSRQRVCLTCEHATSARYRAKKRKAS